MQTTISRRQRSWQALKELDFLSSFFSWFFMLLTRLSEPLMLLSTLYIVAETGVPAIALPALHNLAIGIMITAPEVILPGSFVVASRAQKHARLLFAVCWTFVLLTLITLISLFVWHLTGQARAWLMCARCATAVGYSILMRVMNHSKKVEQVQQITPDLRAQFATMLSEQIREMSSLQSAKIDEMQGAFSTKLNHLEKAIGQQFSPTLAHKSTPISEQFGRFEMRQIVTEQVSEPAWELVEYGAAHSSDESRLEADGQGEAESTISSHFGSNLRQISSVVAPPNQAAKGSYVMSYEEAMEYTGLSIRTLKSKVNSGDIEASANGKLKVKSLEKFRRKSPMSELRKAATSEQSA